MPPGPAEAGITSEVPAETEKRSLEHPDKTAPAGTKHPFGCPLGALWRCRRVAGLQSYQCPTFHFARAPGDAGPVAVLATQGELHTHCLQHLVFEFGEPSLLSDGDAPVHTYASEF